ncbi:hypothetical protein [Mycobacterium sp. URHB0021]
MGGTRGILVHQKPDHMDFNRLLNGIDVSTGDCPPKHLRKLCRLIFPDAVAQLTFESRAEEVRLQPMLQQGASRRALMQLGYARKAVRRTAAPRPHPVVARRSFGNVAAAVPLTLMIGRRDTVDRAARRSRGEDLSTRAGVPTRRYELTVALRASRPHAPGVARG